jgi:precorrin-4/cobalt-precorrin-4 C11-methyltransferase
MKSSGMPEGEDLATLGKSGATLAIHLSIRNLAHIERELSPIPAYGPDCPVVVAYRVGWPDESFIRGTLSTIARLVREAKLTRTALVLVGRGLAAEGFVDSKLYDASHPHILRPNARKAAKGAAVTD